MRKKQFAKKLALNKQTVANLDKNSLSGVVAGADTDPGSICVCPTNGPICQPTTQCTGGCDTEQVECNQTVQATCEGFTCASPQTCNCPVTWNC